MAAAQQRSTIVGVFEDRHQADKAVSELLKAGFSRDQIGVAMRHAEGTAGTTSMTDTDDRTTFTDADDTTAGVTDTDDSHATSGAMAGAVTGLGLGALAGLGVLAGVIPVIGPAIAGGTLGVILSNAAAGAGIAGLVGALVGAGVPEHEAQYYHDEFQAGRTIVTVTANGQADEAMAILRKYGAYDMSSRRSTDTTSTTAGSSLSGTSAYPTGYEASTSGAGDMSGQGSSAGTSTTGRSSMSGSSAYPRGQETSTAKSSMSGESAYPTGGGDDTIQVKEERLHAEKRPVEAGEVKVSKEVHTETKTLEVPVQREEVVIERTPVHGRSAAEGISAGDIGEGEQIRIPVREEHVNVIKDAVVTEEVKVGKRTVQDTEQVSGQVRKEEVKVEKSGDVDVKTRGTGKGTNPV